MNITEIARQAGVSPATVSRVLNSSAPVNPATRLRVLQVVRENNYTRNPAARNVSAQPVTDNIGVLVPDLDNPFFSAVVKEVTRTADALHCNIFLFNTDETPDREHRFLQTVRKQGLKGIIMIPLSGDDRETEQYLLELESAGVPVVLVDRRIGKLSFDSVFTDDEESAYQAVQVLFRAGHTRIATIAGPQYATPGIARLQGYLRAFRFNHRAADDELIRYGDFKLDLAYSLMNELLALPDPPTAVFTANNFSTLGALQSITEHGLTVGKDIAIIGFDEIARWQWYPWLVQSGVGLSLIERPVTQMAQEAMGLLQDRIEGNSPSSRARRRILLANDVVLRGSERLAEPPHNCALPENGLQ